MSTRREDHDDASRERLTGEEDGSAFVSYARSDWSRVEPIVSALRDTGVTVWIDTTSIEPTSEWRVEIVRAIEASDATIAFLSDAFVASRECLWELGETHNNGKKLIPVSIDDVDHGALPGWVSSIQWIPASSARPLEEVVDDLRRTIDLDLAWSSEHARLLVRARDWEDRERPRSRLLRGGDIATAEAAVLQDRPPSQPQPTALQREYVAASRRNRGRLVRTVASVAVVVSLVTSALAIVAVRQRGTALEALADSDFRRLSTQSEAATTQSDGLRLALAALERADAAGRSDTEAVVPLARALARSDVPLMHFSGLAEPDSASGGRQGTDVSADGSTLAHVLSDGSVRVVDLWTLSERAVIEPFTSAYGGGGSGYEVGLDRSGERLVRISVRDYPEDGERFRAGLEIYDLSGAEPERTVSETVELSSYPAGVAFGPQDGVVAVAEDEGTISVIDLDDLANVVHLGTPEERTDASLLRVFFSLDGSRVCTIGERVQLYQVDRPSQLLDVANDRFGFLCIPEPCGASPSNAMAATAELDIECVGPDGSSQGRARGGGSSLPAPTLVALRGLDQDDWDEGSRHRWSVATTQGEGVDPPYWFVTPPDDVVRPLGISYAVPMPTGPGVVSVDADGDIDVWVIGAGVLPDEDELVATDGISRVLAGQSLSSDHPLLALGPRDAEDEAVVVDASSGEPAEPERSINHSADGYEQNEWLLPGGELVALDWDGRVTVYPAEDARPSHYDLDLSSSDEFSAPAVTVEGNLLVHSSADSIDVVDARSGERLSSTAADDDAYCAVGASQGGTRVAAVTCGDGGSAELQIWDDPREAQPTRRLPLAFPNPTTVSLSDDGRTVAVAFVVGQVAVLRDGRWVEPPQLTTASADHNDFQRGWADVDPLGRWMVTRRDGKGIELWHLAGRTVERVGHLSHEWRTDPPLSGSFDAESVSLLWNAGAGSPTAMAVRWPLTGLALRRHACAQIGGIVEASESGDIPRDVCPRVRGQGTRPDPVPIPTSVPSRDPVSSERAASWSIETTRIPLADGAWPSAVGVASDGAVWVAESSLDTLVRIDGSGATASYPIGDTNTSVHSLLPAADGAMWFAGFQTFGRVSRDGTVGLLPGFDDPGAMAPAGDAVYAFVESVEPSLLRAAEDGVDLTPLSSELGGASVPAMALAADGNLWLAIAASVDGSTGPALARLPIDGGSEVERIDLDDVTALHSLVIGPDNGQWFAGTRDDGSGVVGHRLPSGKIELPDTPDEVVAWRLLAAPDAVWFVSDTSLGRIATADNTVAVWPIPNAERLAGIALAPDGTFWLTDSEADVVHHVTLVER